MATPSSGTQPDRRGTPGWVIGLLLALLFLGLAALAASPFLNIVSKQFAPVVHPRASARATPRPTNRPPQAAPCLRPGAVSDPFANDPGKLGPNDFAPPVSRTGGDTAVERTLRGHLCGTNTHGPDERLWAAIDSVLNGSNPNARVGNARWVNGVNRLVGHHIQWGQGRLAQLPFGTQAVTLYMTPGKFPFVGVSPPSSHFDWFLVIPVTTDHGVTITLRLRLKCGFQPYYQHASELPPSLRGPPAP